MARMTRGMNVALHELGQSLDAPRRGGVSLGNWRWLVRQRMAAVRDALIAETGRPDNGWLAARGGVAFRERNGLLARLSTLGAQVLESAEVERVRVDMLRLVGDVGHHMQRINDLAYDDVSLELGGSE